MSSTERIRVMLADDHPIMRDGLRDALEGEGTSRSSDRRQTGSRR